MSDLINRRDAIDAVNAYLGLSSVSRTIQNMTNIQDILEKLSSAEPERKTGKWVIKIEVEHTDKYDARIPHWYCGECGKEYDPHFAREHVNYCYGCGAKMEGSE